MYRSPDNEATLPIIYSMFEFTKEEQTKLLDGRKNYNMDKINKDVKDKSKKMFGSMFKGKKDSGRGSARNESFNGSSAGAGKEWVKHWYAFVKD